ncbi:hypothetical protein FLW53_09560 [Microbispora sp. SCL1-1]|uniref:endonuclease VII domain-containing protein n=1 Tax=Microbispora sp. SCL1-1 TaxID=2592812 RepID=UPI001158F336|nr:hypothetical protein [Microbispora sp. CL1-1]TQS14596.1 hypothetical protein FLW53_09560 [Microbispora sp. SCL1-1]
MSDSVKVCGGCGETKSLDDFSPDRRNRDGRQARCRPCKAKWKREYALTNPERIRAANERHGQVRRGDYRWAQRLRAHYGLTVEQYERLLTGQGGGCAICGTTRPGGPGNRFQVDHDHTCCPGVGSCGRCIRGLLCSNCNTLVGLAKDDPQRLDAAASYLRRDRREGDGG